MSVGRLIPLKGVKYTIQAFAKFVASGGEGELHIYGDGPLRSELESIATSLTTNISFHGNVPNADILAALDSADVLVHSSFREGGSWTILEAMAHGVPVICQDRAGMKDMVTDECGTKVKAATPRKLVEGITSALLGYSQSYELISRNGKSGQGRVNDIYSWQEIGDAVCRIYERVK